MRSDLVFEIGTEENPARFVMLGLTELKDLAEEFMTRERLKYQGIKTFGTPRRLVLQVDGLEGVQEDVTREVRGPAKKVALDGQGNFTKAALGFARSQGIDPEELVVKKIPQGEYVFAVIEDKGKATVEILEKLLPELTLALNFPKSMRWSDKEIRFARPIRWLLAIYGDQVMDFEIDGIRSGSVTFGHRQLAPGPHRVSSSKDYFDVIGDLYCILDQDKRKQLILEGAEAVAREAGGQIILDEDLLDEVTFLVEYPTALCGAFSPAFLELPPQVLITTMKEHQRYFPVTDGDGNLMPAFVTIRNGGSHGIDMVRMGNERVLNARLADARFFYEEDKKVPLIQRVDELSGIVFQEDLGTIAQKVQRIGVLAKYIGRGLGADGDTLNKIQRASLLCKADLVTYMVREFPELQGQMGRDYARLSGEDPLVAQAIFESYLPRFAGDALPASLVGRAVSLADKFDTVVGAFGVGLLPSGSKDPYGLRRQTIGILNILMDSKAHLKLGDIVDETLKIYEDSGRLKRDQAQVRGELSDFFRQRLAGLLQERGFKYDVVDAILAPGFDNVAQTLDRIEALDRVIATPRFPHLVTAISRADRISKGIEASKIEPSLFAHEAERQLYGVYLDCQREVERLLQGDDPHRFFKVLELLSELRYPVDSFFDGVMVMAEDEALRQNRLSLLRKVADLSLTVADLSKLSHETTAN